ncbi:MAG: isocitrate/isopropylmalate family dehydrogenase, partial [Fibrobacterales bacterium]
MARSQHIVIPDKGSPLVFKKDGTPKANNNPIVPYIVGDGIGPDIWSAARRVIDGAVAKAYGTKKKIAWMELYAGDRARELYGAEERLPKETIAMIKKYGVALKGPLGTKAAEGNSLALELRKKLGLYMSIRPIQWFPGVISPTKAPGEVHLTLFRESSEDTYAGIEFKAGAQKTKNLIKEIKKSHTHSALTASSSIAIKPVSKKATTRLVRKAIQYAIDHKRPSVTLVHK